MSLRYDLLNDNVLLILIVGQLLFHKKTMRVSKILFAYKQNYSCTGSTKQTVSLAETRIHKNAERGCEKKKDEEKFLRVRLSGNRERRCRNHPM
jgi:hypothetical protein